MLRRYTCRIDGYHVESASAQDMWDHIDGAHEVQDQSQFWREFIIEEELFTTA